MRLPLMMVLIDASSTAASHDPGATLRRLRPPYHAGGPKGQIAGITELLCFGASVFRYSAGLGKHLLPEASRLLKNCKPTNDLLHDLSRKDCSHSVPRACIGSPCSTARRPRGR